MDYRGVVAASTHRVVETELVPLLAHVFDQGYVVDFHDVCIRYAFECSTSIVFGKDVGYLAVGLPGNELSEAIEDIREAIIFRHVIPAFVWKLMRFLNVGIEKKYARGWKKIDGVFANYISEKKVSMTKGVDPTTDDLLSVYIKNLEELKEENEHITKARCMQPYSCVQRSLYPQFKTVTSRSQWNNLIVTHSVVKTMYPYNIYLHSVLVLFYSPKSLRFLLVPPGLLSKTLFVVFHHNNEL